MENKTMGRRDFLKVAGAGAAAIAGAMVLGMPSEAQALSGYFYAWKWENAWQTRPSTKQHTEKRYYRGRWQYRKYVWIEAKYNYCKITYSRRTGLIVSRQILGSEWRNTTSKIYQNYGRWQNC